MFSILEELKKIPELPGVYIMKDENGHIIYVGKAKILKNRVRQYFQNSNHDIKTNILASQIKSFEYIVTSTEVEALILECNLIKTHRPKYNIVLKDDKQYPYIKVTLNEAFPKVFITRRVKKDKAKYFGPYTDVGAVKETLEVITKHFKTRKCNKKLPKDIGRERPCLNYHIGKCMSPCSGLITEEEYKIVISNILNLLDGKYDKLTDHLTNAMNKASEVLDFEKAAQLRDAIQSIKIVSQKQIITTEEIIDQDIIAFAKVSDEALIQIFFVRSGKIIGREHFFINTSLTDENIMAGFIKQFYNGATTVPKELIVQAEPDDKETLVKWLSDMRGNKVNIVQPKRGEKLKLLNLAAKNASISFEQISEQAKRTESRTTDALNQISEALNLKSEIHRIESYDISNTQGVDSVGVMVVFEKGLPKRSEYRKFKIKTVDGANDYASMEEVITRRFVRYLKELEESKDNDSQKFINIPDLILMDGGKIQVLAAQKVLHNLDIEIPVCGMVKDNSHKTRALFYLGNEIKMPINSEGFKLITRIQDEVHRFAIEYHRKLRTKSQIQTSLDQIEGIGVTRRNSLINHFKSLSNIKQASFEQLLEVKGMNKKAALAVYNYFR